MFNSSSKSIFTMAWPMAISSIVFHSALVIDTMLISPLGEVSLAAMGLAVAIAGVLLGLVFAFSNGTQILVAQAFGANDNQALKTAYWSSFSILILTAIIGLGFLVSYGDNVIQYFAETQEMADLAWSYLSIFSIVVIGRAATQPVIVYFNGVGNTRVPLYSSLIEIPLNGLISLVLVYGIFGLPKLGLQGAALGSAIAVGIKSLYLLITMHIQHRETLNTPGWSKTTLIKSIQHHFLHAIPIAGTFISLTMAKNVCMLMYAKLGIYQFAALTLISPWISIITPIMYSWTNSIGILVGQKLGNSETKRSLDRFIGTAWRCAFALAVLVATLFALASFIIPRVYTTLNQETVDALWSFLPWLLMLPLLKISNAVCGNVLRAGGEATKVMNIQVATQWGVLVPLTALFIFYLELSAVHVFALLVLEEVVKLRPLHKRLFSGEWRRSLVAA